MLKNNKYYEGVNFDYILALRNNYDVIEKLQIPIKKNEGLINDVFRMLEDDAYEADDIYRTFKRQYSDYGDFEYCLGFGSLTAYFIDPITYAYFDETKYRKQAKEYKDRIELAKNETIRDYRTRSFNKWNYRQKLNYIDKCLPYVFASDYHDALVKYDVEKRYFIFSNETHGRFSYSRKVTEDIEIVLKTNFCYGSSSSLLVTVTYKGIPILPYSVWVNYFYAGYNKIIRCTRSYSPQRSNWNTCMDFVIWFVEQAIENPETFVQETIMQEVNTLVDGIGELFKLTDKEMEKRLMISTPDDSLQERYYIGIKTARMANEKDVKYYTIAPEEAKLVYRMEKITGALHFLKSLRQLSEIYDGIELSINRIKEINARLYPEIIKAIMPVKAYIADLYETLKPIEKRLNSVERRFNYLYDRLQKRLENADWEKQDEIRESFVKKNPLYEKLRDEKIELERQVSSLNTQIGNREHYLRQLEDAKSLILKHVISI